MKILPRILAVLALTSAAAFGQPSPAPAPAPALARLTKFDLDFPGGTPGQLVSAIEAATNRPLNAVIPTEYAQQPLPPLKMKGVDAAHLFDALSRASRLSKQLFSSTGNTYFVTLDYGFASSDQNPTDDSIWCFYLHQNNQNVPQYRLCRFYLLTPYLEKGLTVDDITTAIETGWKMLGENGAGALSFHKDTSLLIAVGEVRQLEVVESTLRALDPLKAKPPAAAAGTKAPTSG